MLIQFLPNPRDQRFCTMLINHQIDDNYNTHNQICSTKFLDLRGLTLWLYAKENNYQWEDFEFSTKDLSEPHLNFEEIQNLKAHYDYLSDPVWIKERILPRRIQDKN